MVYFQYKVYLVLINESHVSTRYDVPAFPRGYYLLPGRFTLGLSSW